MCGIFGVINNDEISEEKHRMLFNEGNKIKYRGPDNTQVLVINNIFLMFHRLCINDLSIKGNQPMKLNMYPNIILLCNGEIFNYNELLECNKFKVYSKSDCEIIIHMYVKYGIEKTLEQLSGDFAFILIDLEKNKKYLARDPFGVRSLYIGKTDNDETIFGSELKCLTQIGKDITQFSPGCWLDLDENDYKRFYHYNYKIISNQTQSDIIFNIKSKLEEAVNKRLLSDRPVGCLLSGGLDSSIIASILKKYYKGKTLKTFAVGLKNSVDLKYAKIVADYLETDHYELLLDEDDMFNAIENDIYFIESYDTTTVRASTPMFLLTNYIKNNFDITVLFSGEGSDEASGSYLYFRNAPNSISFYNETVRLLKDLCFFDVLRSEKSVACAGLEARVPFLDKDFIEYYMAIDPALKNPENCNGVEKYLLRLSFESYLPKEIVWRTKEAFSDGVSDKDNSWYSIIQNKVNKIISDSEFNDCHSKYFHNKPILKESLYYRKIFEKNYKSCDKTIPYFWLPKWSGDIHDPSARILNCYE